MIADASKQMLLCDDQFAYRRNYSCTLQLVLCQNDFAKMLNDGDNFDVIYFHFESVFELTTHS